VNTGKYTATLTGQKCICSVTAPAKLALNAIDDCCMVLTLRNPTYFCESQYSDPNTFLRISLILRIHTAGIKLQELQQDQENFAK